MNKEVKLFAVASVVAILASGCSGYKKQGTTDGSSGYASSQNAKSGQVDGNGYNRTTCTPCTTKPRQTYTYKPKPKVVYRPKPKVIYRQQQPRIIYREPKVIYRPQPRVVYKPKPAQQSQYNQQYYINRWNRQQAQAQQPKKPVTTYKAYSPVVGASSTTYYDYSSASKTKYKPYKPRTIVASNKSIYTGGYQKTTYKPYKPTTYSVGARSTYKPATTTKTVYSGRSTGGKSSTYTVKKGDTVFEIMRQTGVYWKDIIRLNNLKAPYNINPGQRIRLK